MIYIKETVHVKMMTLSLKNPQARVICIYTKVTVRIQLFTFFQELM